MADLLARLDNEAQLATVLAHEGAHFILRHGYHASHPKLAERMESYQKLLPSVDAENGAVEAERFESSNGDLRALAIESDLGRYTGT